MLKSKFIGSFQFHNTFLQLTQMGGANLVMVCLTQLGEYGGSITFMSITPQTNIFLNRHEDLSAN